MNDLSERNNLFIVNAFFVRNDEQQKCISFKMRESLDA